MRLGLNNNPNNIDNNYKNNSDSDNYFKNNSYGLSFFSNKNDGYESKHISKQENTRLLPFEES